MPLFKSSRSIIATSIYYVRLSKRLLSASQIYYYCTLFTVHYFFAFDIPTGTNNNSASRGRSVSFAKAKRIKAKVIKKRAGAQELHKAVAIKGVSGKARTGKAQRKKLKQQRRAEKEKETKDAQMDIETAPSNKKKAKKKASGGDAMQE